MLAHDAVQNGLGWTAGHVGGREDGHEPTGFARRVPAIW
jgi:hypothetical protein